MDAFERMREEEAYALESIRDVVLVLDRRGVVKSARLRFEDNTRRVLRDLTEFEKLVEILKSQAAVCVQSIWHPRNVLLEAPFLSFFLFLTVFLIVRTLLGLAPAIVP
jgi:hypothetical protein